MLSLSVLFCLLMAHLKGSARLVGIEAQPEATNTVSQEVTKALSSLVPSSVASSPSREGSILIMS
jgi:hypothetical protein